jgi:sugar/nucleoside kinase (ribokinase family)
MNNLASSKNLAIVIGDINIDIITPPFDPAVLKEGETSCVLDEFTMSLGGNAINVAAALATLGDNHVFLGGMGDCAISEWIQKKCKILGVNTQLSILPGKTAGITFALTYFGGKRQFVATLGTNKQISAEKLNLGALDTAQKPFHLHRAGFWYTPLLKGQPTIDIFKKTITKGGETSIDVGWDPENFSDENRELLYKTLNYTNYFFANEKEVLAITKKTNIAEAQRELLDISTAVDDPKIILHRGEKGCAVISRKENLYIDPYPVKNVINPTGSGDIFNGGFIHGLLHEWSLKECAEFAGKLAAIHLQDITKIYPNLEDVKNL